MNKKLLKFICIMSVIIILSVIYLFYINSDGYKEARRVEVPQSIQIYINDNYIDDTKLNSYKWNQGKLESGFEDIKENNYNIFSENLTENLDVKFKKGDIIKFKLLDKYLDNKYKIESAVLELYLNEKLYITYKAEIQDNQIIIKEDIKEGKYVCNLKLVFKDRGNTDNIFKITI